jgi:hypothetical protein
MARKQVDQDDGGYRIKNCKGAITIGDKALEVVFDFSCDNYGEVTVDVAQIPLCDASMPLFRLDHARGRYAQKFKLRGANDEFVISTDSAHMVSSRQQSTRDEGTTLSPQVRASTFLVEAVTPVPASSSCLVQYHVSGMVGAPLQQVESPVGKFMFQAPWRLEDHGLVSGILVVEAEGVTDVQDWLRRCDDQVHAVLDILSFANGSFLRWSIRQHFVGGAMAAATYRGRQRTSRPNEPVFYSMNLKPVVQLAIEKYTADLRTRTGMGVALEWFLMNPSYSEAQVMALMTAIEHLVETYSQAIARGNLDKAMFKSIVQPAIDKALGECESSATSGLTGRDLQDMRNGFAAIRSKVHFLNMRNLKANVRLMLKHYGVPMANLDAGAIDRLVNARNDIVHRGLYQRENGEGVRLQDHVGFARELLRRVFLTLLGYVGEYRTWHEGPKTAMFPNEQKV